MSRFVVKPLSDIVTIWDASWIGWVMCLFLVVLAIMEYKERGIISHTFRYMISPIERVGYNQIESKWVTHLLGMLFRVCVLGMGLYLAVGDRWHCHPWGWLVAVGLVIGMHGVKLACAAWVNYLFHPIPSFSLIYTHYVAVWMGMALIVYPCVLVAIRWSAWENYQPLGYLIVGVYLLAVWIKMLRSIPIRWNTMVYSLLYLMTVEVLPIAGVIYIGQTWKL